MAGFFSRRDEDTENVSDTENEERKSEDEEYPSAVEADALHLHLQAIVEEEIVLRHPIVALSRNICNLVHTKNLSILPVAMLRVICEGIGLNVNEVTGKGKSHLKVVLRRSLRSALLLECDRCNAKNRLEKTHIDHTYLYCSSQAKKR